MNKSLSIPALFAALLSLGGCGDQASSSAPKPTAATITAAVPRQSPVLRQDTLTVRRPDAAQVARGRRVYQANCAVCHGQNGQGTTDWNQPGPNGKYPPPPLDDSAHAWHHPTAMLRQVIRQGSPGGQGDMPAWQGKLSRQEINDVVAYITSLWSGKVYALWYRQVEHRARQ